MLGIVHTIIIDFVCSCNCYLWCYQLLSIIIKAGEYIMVTINRGGVEMELPLVRSVFPYACLLVLLRHSRC